MKDASYPAPGGAGLRGVHHSGTGPGLWALCGYALVALVGWSRVALRDHTPGQVIAGTILGSAVAAAVFALLR
ncbi:phosphatase PAP2 family protein [Streptomyces sp. NPDC014983]|uniref:phosphatase PAP2 family protein n=1 Tax=Streptomyces sp. NPDC014983 TaxID=3364933 RepID=UPI003701DFE3